MSKAEKWDELPSRTAHDEFPTPYLGRSVRLVGPHVNVDMNQSPHPKNQRGELGKPLFNWYRNTVSKDPLTRVSAPNHFADRRHFLVNVINRSTNGKVNPRRIAVDDPAVMARHIKAVARYMGADVVGIAKAHPSFLYAAGGGRYVQDGTAKDDFQSHSPEDLVRRFLFIIQATTAWDYNKLQAHRHHIGDAAYHVEQRLLLHHPITDAGGGAHQLRDNHDTHGKADGNFPGSENTRDNRWQNQQPKHLGTRRSERQRHFEQFPGNTLDRVENAVRENRE